MIAPSLLLIAATALATAGAEPHRVAVVVGANRGALGRADLRYSYRDAKSVADALVQVGQFAPANVHVLQDPDPALVISTLDRELGNLRAAGGESLLLFYYSGHADEAALYPAGRPLRYEVLRSRLESDLATVRVGIIDACNGGGWTGAKGLVPSFPFSVDVPLELAGEGSVLIASSSGLEAAHESEGILGSFFTHHLVAGLRGAADPRGDGVVTVSDAFAYAKERTVRDTASISPQPQHPSFSMNLRGRADLPLSRIASAPSLVELQQKQGPLQLIHLGTGVVVLEVPSGRRALKLSVPPGRYLLRREGEQGNYSREISVESGRSVQVNEEELQLSSLPSLAVKGLAGGAVEQWPLAINDRPLTLSARLAQVELGLLLDAGKADVTESPALAPMLRYGVTDRLSLSASAPYGFCVGKGQCFRDSAGMNVGASFLLLPEGPVEVAATVNVGYEPRPESVPLVLGAVARIGGEGRLAFVLTPQIGYEIKGRTTLDRWIYALGGQFVFQAHQRVALDVGSVLQRAVSSRYRFLTGPWEPGPIPVIVGATWTPAHYFDARAQLSFENVLGVYSAPPGDHLTLGFYVSFRG